MIEAHGLVKRYGSTVAVISEPFLILAVTGSSRSGDVAACRRRE
jgi:hypothetical protein